MLRDMNTMSQLCEPVIASTGLGDGVGDTGDGGGLVIVTIGGAASGVNENGGIR